MGGACKFLSAERPEVPSSFEVETVDTPYGPMYVTGTTQKKAMVRGSFDTKIAIQSSPDHAPGTHIWVSGSPKPLQGHNLFGSDDPRKLAAHLARYALQAFGLEVDPFTWKGWLEGNRVKFTRIDITQMLDTGSEHNAAEWLKAVAEFATVKHRGRGRESHGTVYFGKTENGNASRRWMLKLYRKFIEIESRSKSHRLPDSIDMREALIEYARGTVRAEFTFQSLELKRLHLQNGEMWKTVQAVDIWRAFMEKLELPGNFTLDPFDVESLPRAARSIYREWASGTDMRTAYPRATFYRYRAMFKRFGIDIATPCNRRGVVRPLIRVIEATPKQVPTWAHNTPLLYAA